MTARYWIMKDADRLRVYGIRNHFYPHDHNLILWSGDDYKEALAVCSRLSKRSREEKT